MQVPALVALTLATMALAGCSGDDGHGGISDVTCPDGTVVTGAQIEADEHHHEDGFDVKSLCPVAPAVSFTGLPPSLQVYSSAAFEWAVDPGSVQHGHSMLTAIRYSLAPVADADATLETYSKEVLKKEHQDLPVAFRGNLTFNVPGKVYLRAYAQVQGTDFNRIEVWSHEVTLDVLPVQPTGNNTTVTHTLGPLDPLDPAELTLGLGDGVVFKNDDLVTHTLTATSGPSGSVACELEADGQGGVSEACVFLVPGSYTFETDDVQAKTLKVSVPIP